MFKKKAYKTADFAKLVVEEFFKKRNIILHCYYCSNCCNYHLTKKNIDSWKNKIF